MVGTCASTHLLHLRLPAQHPPPQLQPALTGQRQAGIQLAHDRLEAAVREG